MNITDRETSHALGILYKEGQIRKLKSQIAKLENDNVELNDSMLELLYEITVKDDIIAACRKKLNI